MFELALFTPDRNASNGTNSTDCDSLAGSADPAAPHALLFKSVFVALGVVNLAMNSLSAVIFLCHRQRKGRLIRLLLLLLSSTEVVASFAMSSVEASRIVLEVRRDSIVYASKEVARRVVQYLAVTWAMANAALMARNWCIVLIAVSRCEAVVRPFSRHTGRRCGPRAVIAAFIAISVAAALISAPKALQELYYLCPGELRIIAKDIRPPFAHYGEFYLATVFCQAVLPVAIVGAASAAMTLGLRAHSRRAGQAASRAHYKATRMIQLLLLVFVCLELPMFVTVLIGIRGQDGGPGWDTFMSYAVDVSNLCINLDSTCNFFVYMKTNWAFRSAVLRRSLRLRRPPPSATGFRGSSFIAAAGATGTVVRSTVSVVGNSHRRGVSNGMSLFVAEQMRRQRRRRRFIRTARPPPSSLFD